MIEKTAEFLSLYGKAQITYEEHALQLLHLASTHCHSVRLLLFKGHQDYREQEFRYDLLSAAAFTNNIGIVKNMVCTQLRQSWFIFPDPFQMAMLARDYDMLALLLAVDTELLRKGTEERINLISQAAKMGDMQLVQFFLQPAYNPFKESAMSIRARRRGGRCPLSNYEAMRILRTPNVEVFELIRGELKSRKLSSISKESLLENCLRYAISRGWVDITKYLIALGIPLNVVTLNGRAIENSLCWACRSGHDDIVKVLLDGGAHIYGVELGIAASRGHASIVKILLEKGADVNATASKNSLYAAARRGRLEIVKALLDAGMDPNTGESSTTSPLIGAVKSEHVSMIRMLVQRGVVLSRVLPDAMKIAEAEGLDSILSLLDEYRTTEHARLSHQSLPNA